MKQAQTTHAAPEIEAARLNFASHVGVHAPAEQDRSFTPAPTNGRDLSQSSLRPTEPVVGRDYGKVSCPVAPQRCPFGGACHACPARVQRTAATGESERGRTEAPPVVHEVLRSPGQPLDPAVRVDMESLLGHDFSRVRLHTGERATEATSAVNARAFTVGSHVVFGRGQYAPATSAGRQLVGHELVHVAQQSAAGAATPSRLAVAPVGDSHEQEAESIAAGLSRGHSVGDSVGRLAGSGLVLRRACGIGGIGAPTGCAVGRPVFMASYPSFRFSVNCDDFASGQEAALIAGAQGLPPTAQFEVHGYASLDGDRTFNQNLSCARALKARRVLTDAPPAGAGIDAARVVGIFSHGETPGPAVARHGVVLAPRSPTALPSAVPPAGPTDFQIRRVGRSSTSRIYFALGSSALTHDATVQVNTLKAAPPGPVRLIGYASADEPPATAQSRANEVRTALTTMPNALTVTSAVGNAAATAERSDFTEARSVEILVGAATPSTLNCAERDASHNLVHPPKQPCSVMDPATDTAFTTALPVANDAMNKAVTAVAGVPSTNTRSLIDRFFGNHSAATLGTLRTNLGNLRAHVANLPAHTQCGGQCDTGGCAEGPIAYNSGVGPAAPMTLCVPVFRDMPVNDAARNLIHESAHGTAPLGGGPGRGTADVAYRHERMMFQLSPAERLRNSDSYALFALFVREVQDTGDPTAAPGDIDTPASDTLTGFGTNEPALRLALARLEKRLSWAKDWTGQLYGEVNAVRTGTRTWATSWAEDLMREASTRFPLTAPPAAPAMADQTRIASIAERYERMSLAAKESLTVTSAPTGGVSWPAGGSWLAGASVRIGPEYFRLSPDDQVSMLLEQLSRATRDIEPAFVPAYVMLAEWIHRQNP